MVSPNLDAALAQPDYKSPASLQELDALPSEAVPLLQARLEAQLPKLGRWPELSSEEQLVVIRMTIALSRHLHRDGKYLPAHLEPALRCALDTFLEHLHAPEAVHEAMRAVPSATFESIALQSRVPTSFWTVLPAFPTPAVLKRAVELVMGWQKKRLSSSLDPKIACGAFLGAGTKAVPALAAGIMVMEKEAFRAVLVDALASLPAGGVEALVRALGDSSAEVSGHARRGLLARKAEAIPALDAALVATKKAKLKQLLKAIRAEIGPVELQTRKTALRTPIDEARASTSPARVSEIRSAILTDPSAWKRFVGEPQELLLASMDAAISQHQGDIEVRGRDLTYEMHEAVRDLSTQAVAAWCAVGALIRRRKKIDGKRVARGQLRFYAEILGAALREPVVAALGDTSIPYSDLYFEWLAENPVVEAAPLLVKGLASSKTVQGHCQSALVSLGEAGARAALEARGQSNKGIRRAAAEVVLRVAAPALIDEVKLWCGSEKDAVVLGKLDAALGANAPELI